VSLADSDYCCASGELTPLLDQRQAPLPGTNKDAVTSVYDVGDILGSAKFVTLNLHW
jgi:hypothetical protein